MNVVTENRMNLFTEMEEKYEKKDTEYFVNLLDHQDYVIRTRATCILVDIGGEDKVNHIAKILKDDPNELVRWSRLESLAATDVDHEDRIAILIEELAAIGRPSRLKSAVARQRYPLAWGGECLARELIAQVGPCQRT